MSDPINSAVERASAPAPTRFGGQVKLPSGEVAMVDLPVPVTPLDMLALIAVLAEAVIQAPSQTEAPSRIIVPAH